MKNNLESSFDCEDQSSNVKRGQTLNRKASLIIDKEKNVKISDQKKDISIKMSASPRVSFGGGERQTLTEP